MFRGNSKYLILMFSDENMFDFSFRYSPNFCRVSYCIKKNDQLFLETPSVSWMINQEIFCVVCRDMFLSTTAVLFIVVYFFDHIVIETHSVFGLRNQSRDFVVFQIFYHMGYPWLQVFSSLLGLDITDGYSWIHIFSSLIILNRTDQNDPTLLGFFHKGVKVFEEYCYCQWRHFEE